MLKFPNAQALALLGVLVDVDGLLNGAKMKLFKNNLMPTPNSVIADFEIADFTGFSTSTALVWGTPYYQADGTPVVLAGAKTFIVTSADPVVGNTIYGYYITDGAGTALLYSERFDSPVLMAIVGTGITVEPAFSLQSQS